jgi:hypothetical protein
MAHLMDCCQNEEAALERVHYVQRMLLTADDMTTDQDYVRQRLRRHNRFLHGWGVVCGLGVTAAPTDDTPWRVRIDAGYALAPLGDEIFVAEPVHLDLARCGPGAETDPCEPDLLRAPAPGTGTEVLVAIKYAECMARPVRILPPDCGCDETACEYSRVRDTFQIGCLTDLPPTHEKHPAVLLCDLLAKRQAVPCPPCPTDPWVVLAEVRLPAAKQPVEGRMILPGPRRQLYSTALLQEQLIECCCGPRRQASRPVPAGVASVIPASNTTVAAAATITVTFDKGVKPATVNADTLVVMRGTSSAAPQVPGTVAYAAATRQATFRPKRALDPGDYTILVRGSGAKHVIDVDDLALDGNGDGTEGGNFTSQFHIG